MTRVVLLGVQVFTMIVSVAVGVAVVRLRKTKVRHEHFSKSQRHYFDLLWIWARTLFASYRIVKLAMAALVRITAAVSLTGPSALSLRSRSSSELTHSIVNSKLGG